SYGVLLWLPGELIAEGRNMGVAAAIIARSTFISVPVVALAAFLYSRWSTKGALLVMVGISAAGLLAVVLRQGGRRQQERWPDLSGSRQPCAGARDGHGSGGDGRAGGARSGAACALRTRDSRPRSAGARDGGLKKSAGESRHVCHSYRTHEPR